MCILQPCANPTQVGVWWRDDTQWCLYSADHQARIRKGIASQLEQIDLGTIFSNVHPKGAQYVVKLSSKEQVAVSSGQRRPVMVIDPVSVFTPQLEAPPQATLMPSSPGSSSGNISLNLHYKDSQGNLQRYDRSIANAIIQSLRSGNQSTLLVPDGRSGHLFFNLETMEQYYVSHLVKGQPVLSDRPPIEVIAEVPWDAAAMASLAAKADKCLRRSILVMVIDRFRSEDHLDTILSAKAGGCTVVSKSTSACPTGQYEKFIDSVEDIVHKFPGVDIMGKMIKIAGSEDVGSGPIQIAFKPVERTGGVSSKHISDVGTARTRTSFWMSMAAPVAAAHAVVYGCTVQILAYLVILPTCTLKDSCRKLNDECSGHVEVDRPEHQLPVAAVTVR